MGNTTAQAFAISLTIWSSRRPQAPLAGALRASHSGAAYPERWAPSANVLSRQVARDHKEPKWSSIQYM